MAAISLVLTESMAQSKPRRGANASRQPAHQATTLFEGNHLALPEGLADRCYAMAEALNARAELALAVPFYRQAIALLIAQRDRQTGEFLEGSAEVASAAQAVMDVDRAFGAPSGSANRQSDHLPTDLQGHLQALADDLCLETAVTVRQVVLSLLDELPVADAQLLSLLAKTHLLEGELEEALANFRHAVQLEPTNVRHCLNCGGAFLACGDFNAALKMLRPLLREVGAMSDPALFRALLQNLSTAELEGGHIQAGARLRADLAGLDPDAIPLHDWLEDARQWIAAGWRAEAKGLLVALRALFPRDPSLLRLLAETLEASGDYRDAALVYRDLLRPSLTGS